MGLGVEGHAGGGDVAAAERWFGRGSVEESGGAHLLCLGDTCLPPLIGICKLLMGNFVI